jgi:hypothetical protein
MRRLRMLQALSWALLLCLVVVLLINWLGTPLPDWAVRTAGLGALAALAVTAFCTVRLARLRR